MKVTISDHSGVTKAVLSGRMDTTGIDEQEALVTASIIPKGQNTIIDLTDVTFVASMGVRMLLTLARSLARGGAKLVLYGAAPAVTEVIETTALSQIIPVAQSEEDALAAIYASLSQRL